MNGYTIRLATETHEMRDAGRKMHICVGSYSDRAVEKELNIVLIRNKETERYEACLELTGDFSAIRQAKTHCNDYPEGELKDTILEWASKNRIKIATTDTGKELNKSFINSSFFISIFV